MVSSETATSYAPTPVIRVTLRNRHLLRRRPTHYAVTLIELLVVFAVIGVLLAILFPAVQQARETARGSVCRSNLKQIGLAVQLYQTANTHFPPSFCTTDRSNALGSGNSWSIHGRLLPYLEQHNAYDHVKLEVDWHSQISSGVTHMPPRVYLCPDEPHDFARMLHGKPYVHPVTYGFNFGTWQVYDPVTNQGSDGAFFVNSRLTPASFRDGLSHTLCATEVKAYTSYIRNTNDPGSALPNSPSFFRDFSGQMKLGSELTRNTGHTVWCDGRVHHTGITTVFTPNTIVPYELGGKTYDIDFNSQQEGKSAAARTYAAVTTRSYHCDIVFVVRMDGSVASVSNSIELAILA